MKRFILPLLLCVGCYQGPREAADMPSPYMPNSNNNPASITLPSPGDPVASAVADQAWKDIVDKAQFVYAGFTASTATLAALTGIPDGGKIYVRGNHGLYERLAAGTPNVSDGYWLVNSADGGQFVHENYGGATGQKIAYIGPAPGETTTIPTPSAKINPRWVVGGQVSYVTDGNLDPSTVTNTRAYANPTTTADELTGDDLGTTHAGDIIRGWVHAGVTCANDFHLGVFVTEDNGSSWHLRTPAVTGSSVYPSLFWTPNTGSVVSVDLSFTYVVQTGGVTAWRIRGQGGGSLLTVQLSSRYVEIIHP